MLIKAEKILSRGDMPENQSEQEIFHSIRNELVQELVNEMMRNGLVKTELFHGKIESFGDYTKVIVSARAYHPDS